jgi:hypothetical protein
MRKTVLVAFVLLSCLVSAAGAQVAIARLTGANESPGPGDSDGFGLAGLRIEGTTISFTIMVQGIATPTASHIHRGAAGVAGPVVVPLASSFPNNVAVGAATSGVLPFLSQASVPDIQAGLGFRSNIGWFNPNLTAAGATFVARRASDGSVLGSVSVTINVLSQVQQAVFSLISGVAAADQVQTDFYLTWTSTIPIYVYGAVVDNKTGDVVYVD